MMSPIDHSSCTLQFWSEKIDPNLLHRARRHSSIGEDSNERLEFLGNGVLNLCLADLLYNRFQYREGKLTRMCNYLRSDDVLNELGRELELDAQIELGRSIKDGKSTNAMVAGAIEAIIGALFSTCGYDLTRNMVEELLMTDRRLEQALSNHDPITELKELVEGRGLSVGHLGYA